MPRVVSKAELAQHSTPEDCWVSLDGNVYDVTKFLKSHPGGEKILYDYGGRDCTEAFYELHRQDILKKFGPKLLVGPLEGSQQDYYNRDYPLISEVPYAEGFHFQGGLSPYFNDSHRRFKKNLRKLIYSHTDHNKLETMAKMGRDPKDALWKSLAKQGFHRANIAPSKEYPVGKYTNFVDYMQVNQSEYDYFHEMIFHIEINRIGAPGMSDAFQAGLMIGLPPVMHFKTQNPALTERIVRECLTGEKRICLAISEPWAGSDVANVNVVAEKTPCGKFYIVNGLKKWITGGYPSTYFTTAVRTGTKKLSFLVIDRRFGGVTTKKISTRYSPAAGTSLVIFENVKVPVDHLLGREGNGFKMIMHNFNHERWGIACSAIGICRRAIEEVALWFNQRKAFKKKLMDQPALRQRLAEMISQTEALQCYAEQITWQMQNMPFEEQNKKLGGPICLFKCRAAHTVEWVTNEAVQLFGGRGLTNTGMGQIAVRLAAFNQYVGIYGGSNEVLADYAVRMMARGIPKHAKL